MSGQRPVILSYYDQNANVNSFKKRPLALDVAFVRNLLCLFMLDFECQN